MTQPKAYGEDPGVTSVATSCCLLRYMYQTVNGDTILPNLRPALGENRKGETKELKNKR